MKEYSLKDLGQLVGLFVRGKHFADAQKHLDEMQARVNAAKEAAAMPGILETKPGWEEKPNELLEQLPMVETTEPTLEHKQPVVNITNIVSEPEHVGPPRDAQGNITRISTQLDDPGYDPEIHENKELKIFCDDVHITTAHTADTVKGLVLYYEKNEKGRIKTLEKRGKVDILGL